MSLLAKIKGRVFELMIIKGVSRAEATRLAANEFGAVEAIKDTTGALPTKPEPTIPAESSAKEELFSRIMSIRSRMKEQVTTAARSLIPRVRLREDDEPAAPSKSAGRCRSAAQPRLQRAHDQQSRLFRDSKNPTPSAPAKVALVRTLKV